MCSATADGAWGLRFPSMHAATHVLMDAPSWPAVDLEVCDLGPVSRAEGDTSEGDTSEGDTSEWDDHGMKVDLPAGGRVEIVWPFAVTLRLPERPIPECVVQPHLTTAAASIALRRGRQPFHAGAFEVDGRAWAVLGAKEAGKSSTLALAAEGGSLVITDDLLVVEDGLALAGPRCIDLRAEPASVLGVGEDLGTVGLRERWRVHVPACPAATPLAGFIVPAWGPDGIRPLPAVDRLRLLFSNSAMQGISMNDPDQYLRLASLPMLSWTRPRSWVTARGSFDTLREQLSRTETDG